MFKNVSYLKLRFINPRVNICSTCVMVKNINLTQDSLTGEIDMNKASTKILSKLWEKKLLEFKSTMVHNQIMASFKIIFTKKPNFT